MNELGYPIHIEPKGYSKVSDYFLFENYSRVVVCVDPQVYKYHEHLFRGESTQVYILSHDGEKAKDFASIQGVCDFFRTAKLDRHSLVLAVGGGAIGDAIGFAASIFMRGISVAHIPTTLLSMVDSSVGAKTAINFAGVKNLIGTFHPPVGVLIDIDFLQSLPTEEFSSGCAEIIKHGVIADADYFHQVRQTSCKTLEAGQLCQVIARSIEIKSSVVLKDPKEVGERKILNFGHTLGHCIEAHTKIAHGKAIAIGMVLEALLASELYPAATTLPEAIKDVLRKNNLPSSFADISTSIPWDAFYQLLLLDKKNKDGKILFALPTRLGECAFDIAIPVEKIKEVVEKAQ